jgi:hypothetical protein
MSWFLPLDDDEWEWFCETDGASLYDNGWMSCGYRRRSPEDVANRKAQRAVEDANRMREEEDRILLRAEEIKSRRAREAFEVGP